ncbi:MAG: nicotinate (nicotinamide) nucleotide adenylyltransferase [Acidobacteria bacterium]|nr:nicotinate (nicotinamide) nucleotide adenylyltransferase [Acidobacteriota bacterium]
MKIAIFGGTFDPVHNAHLAIARAAVDRFALDQVLFIPAANPPHKPGRAAAPYQDRLAMVRIAVRDQPRFEASGLEAREEKSYSIRTIERLRARLAPSDELYFLIGADAFAEITTWYRWRDVLRSVIFLIVTRPGHRYEVPADARALELSEVELPVSATVIRERLARGEQVDSIPPGVLEYIRTHGLYTPETGTRVT